MGFSFGIADRYMKMVGHNMGQMMLKNCSICGKPAVEAYRPFCSARCANIDLGRWLGERYSVPTDEAPSPDGGLSMNEED